MAEVLSMRNNVLPYPLQGKPYTVIFAIKDADGDLVTGAADLDSEVSKNGNTFTDCTNEATEIATNSGVYYLTLTAAEMSADMVAIIVKTSTSGAKTVCITLYPTWMAAINQGTAEAGGAATITLQSGVRDWDNAYMNCLVYIYGGTGSGQLRKINAYVGSTRVATVNPAWETQPSTDSTYYIYPTAENCRANSVNVQWISDDPVAATNMEAFFDGTGYAGGTAKLEVDVSKWKGATAPDMTGDAYAKVDTEIGTLQADVTLILEDTGTTIPATLSGLAASAASAVWSSLLTALTTTGSIGKSLADWFTSGAATITPFSATAVQICNNALLLLGNNAIVAITDNTKAAKLCAQFYQQTVDAVLRAYTWNCATYRSAALTATTAPSFGFSYAFTLPTDCLRVLMIEDDETIPFRVESGVLLTDESTAKISYIKRITIDDADGLLIEAISARLAATMAFSLTNSTTAAEAMWKLYKDKLDEAQTTDAFEGTAPQLASSDWINSRG
jgi:hypothetical protein